MQMNMQLYPLQEEIKLLNRTVEILQERVRDADDKLVKYQAGIKEDIHAGGDNPVTKKKGWNFWSFVTRILDYFFWHEVFHRVYIFCMAQNYGMILLICFSLV